MSADLQMERWARGRLAEALQEVDDAGSVGEDGARDLSDFFIGELVLFSFVAEQWLRRSMHCGYRRYMRDAEERKFRYDV